MFKLLLLFCLLVFVLHYIKPFECFVSTAEMDDLNDTFDRASNLQYVIR
jgi:hypothetical protein